jgi:Pyruvate/2-oxoacid:ferredoxin oxidoreductase delta subunit
MELDALTRIRVPVVKADACVGCGICQYRCHTRYVLQEHRLTESAVRVAAENHVRQAFQPDFSGRSG